MLAAPTLRGGRFYNNVLLVDGCQTPLVSNESFADGHLLGLHDDTVLFLHCGCLFARHLCSEQLFENVSQCGA